MGDRGIHFAKEMGPNAMMILSFIAYAAAAAADATLYDVDDKFGTPVIILESATYSAVGVDSGGSTTYVGTVVESLYALPEGTTTLTLLSTPTTYPDTFVEGGSGIHYVESYTDGVLTETCTFLGHGEGSCVWVQNDFDGRTTIAETGGYTGTLVPWTTIGDPRLQWATGAPSGAGALHFGSTLAVICLSAVYLLL